MLQFTVLDYSALLWFFFCWIGYIIFADHTGWYHRSVRAAMSEYRSRWMQVMLQRELRIIDTTIQSSLLSSVGFFASTTIFVIGGLFAMLGASDTAIGVLRDLPFAVSHTATLWESKLLLLVFIFIYAFFKFAWAYRLFNYCAVLIGAAPMPSDVDDRARRLAARTAELNSIAAGHFNDGLRAYFFALAALAWFIHPGFFIVATGWVTLVLQRREFRSHSLDLLAPLDEPSER